MTLPPKQCLCCGREIIKDQFCAETPDQFAKRYNGGWCRAKCKRNLPSPSPKDRPTLVADPTAWNLERPEGKEQPKEKPVRDAARLAFARSMPCVACGSIEGIHAHHEQEEGHGVMGGKVCDRRSVGLCWLCHCRRHEEGRSFYGGIDIEGIILRTNAAYDILCQSKQCS